MQKERGMRDMCYKICVWGVGKIYNRLVNTLKYYECKKEIEVVAVTAREVPDCMFLDGWRVIDHKYLGEIFFDYIIIADEIPLELTALYLMLSASIQRDKMIPFKVLEIPNLDFSAYVYLKNSRLSIVSNNCWGGLVYYTLGLECLSPFKNVSFADKDYIKLLQKLDHYMGCSPAFYEMCVEPNIKTDYPVLLLDDVKIHCNHSTDPDQAIADWVRRSRKFNWDNVLITMYTEDAEIEKSFLQLEKYKKKICFVSHTSQNKDTYELNFSSGQTELWEAVNSCAVYEYNSGLMYNLVELLNRNKNPECVRREK